MPGFSRRPIAVFVCCLFAGISVARAEIDVELKSVEQGAVGSPDPMEAGESPLTLAANDAPPVKLRVERKFNVLGKKKPSQQAPVVGIDNPAVLKHDDSYPLFLIADQVEGRMDEATVAEGNVELRKAGTLMFAEKMVYRPLDDEIEATGQVKLLQEGAEVDSPHLRMKLSEQIGFADQASYYIVREVPSKFYRQQQTIVTVATSNATTSGAPMMLNVPNSYGLPTKSPEKRETTASGEAERIDFEGENQMHMSAVTYSTCKPGENDWYLKSSGMDLDYDRNVGDASNSTLWFMGAPIFYTPYASFALNRERRSGFLHPSIASSTRNGIDFTLPYYWNIAPNYDATFYPRYMAKRGFQLGAEGRYLGTNFNGESRVEYLPNDAIENKSRYGYTIRHQQTLGRGLSATVNLNGVSDDTYWEDMSSKLLQTSQTQLPKQVQLAYSPSPWLQSSLQVLRYQTLQPDPENPIARPYFLEPQLNLVGFKPNLLKTDFSLIGQFSRFTHPDKVQGDRFVFYPQLSLPIVNPAFQITPKIGLHMTKYSLEQQATGEPTTFMRTLPTFTLDSTMIFEREGKWLDIGYIQTLEPRLYYVNIPYKDQSRIPVFDSGLSDFNFAQIFSENRYSGFDRINDANQLTAAVTTRLLDAETGVERFKAMVGQRYYFQPQRVTITGETTRQADFSNLIAAVNGLVAPKTYMDVAWEYNNRQSSNERFSAGVRFQPELGKVLSASYRYTRDPLTNLSTVDQVDFAGQWPISAHWYAVGRYNWSLRDNQLLESVAGLEYNASCWSARIVAQRLEAISGSPNTTVYFQLELNDFASIGSNPLGLLRRSIPGYGKTNELPDSGSLLTTP